MLSFFPFLPEIQWDSNCKPLISAWALLKKFSLSLFPFFFLIFEKLCFWSDIVCCVYCETISIELQSINCEFFYEIAKKNHFIHQFFPIPNHYDNDFFFFLKLWTHSIDLNAWISGIVLKIIRFNKSISNGMVCLSFDDRPN